jgi:hypothetical protein
MPNESAYVQVAVDGAGKKIANVSIIEPQGPDASGNAQADLVRYYQAVVLSDDRGNPVDFNSAMLDALEDIGDKLDLILAALTG